jgi:hypothetical protein
MKRQFNDFAGAAARCAVCLLAAGGLMLGCQSQKPDAVHAVNPSLTHIETAPGATKADADRAALARFVGVWNFNGWCTTGEGARREAAGQAAGTIENTHFVLLDLQATSGELSGNAGRKSGSMLFASEPDVGPTLTAWGDANASLSRFVGDVQGHRSAFMFEEVKTPAGRHRHSIAIVFQTDDAWTAEIRDSSAAGTPLLARYEFTRVRD